MMNERIFQTSQIIASKLMKLQSFENVIYFVWQRALHHFCYNQGNFIYGMVIDVERTIGATKGSGSFSKWDVNSTHTAFHCNFSQYFRTDFFPPKLFANLFWWNKEAYKANTMNKSLLNFMRLVLINFDGIMKKSVFLS